MQRDLLALAGLVEEAIHKAIRALQERDTDLAREVVAGDSQVDEEENQLVEECLKILALNQPVASDLRRVASTMMISTDLERMGDLAEVTAPARVVLRTDDEVDRYNREIIQDLIGLMKESPELIEASLSMFSAVRHLERISDHATNIAEDVVYLAEGEIVRHRTPAS